MISFVRPVYVDRYITGSAPGLALTVGLLVAWTFESSNVETRSLPRLLIAPVVVTVVLLANALPVTNTVLENMSGAAGYLAIHATKDSEGAYLDHSAAASVEYYLANDHARVMAFPQSKHQLNL
ncbi:MAG: hypothetical protein WCA31_05040, partial [Acidimicrobiales bacterium]